MRVVLPGGICADWSPDEVAEAMRILTQILLAEATGRPSGLILAHPQIVRYNDRHARLTPTQYALVRFLMSHGPADFDVIKEAVWMKPISDKRVANACSETSAALSEAGIPYEISADGSVVSLSEISIPGNPGQIRESHP